MNRALRTQVHLSHARGTSTEVDVEHSFLRSIEKSRLIKGD